jgi:hypothetical protein
MTMVPFKVGDILGAQVRIRITAVEPTLMAEVLEADEFWSSLPTKNGICWGQDSTNFQVGQILVFRGPLYWQPGRDVWWNIESPTGLPWFSLGVMNGHIYFEHYR